MDEEPPYTIDEMRELRLNGDRLAYIKARNKFKLWRSQHRKEDKRIQHNLRQRMISLHLMSRNLFTIHTNCYLKYHVMVYYTEKVNDYICVEYNSKKKKSKITYPDHVNDDKADYRFEALLKAKLEDGDKIKYD